MYESKTEVREPTSNNFDKWLNEASTDCVELKQEYSRYLQLKNSEYWEDELLKQKPNHEQ
jgi:hypothetical protein